MNRLCKRLTALALGAMLLCLPALAAETEETAASAKPQPVRVWGTVQRLDEDSLRLTNSDPEDPYRDVILHLNQETAVVNAVSGSPMSVSEIREGETVYAWVGPAMTMSLPPQASAEVVIAGIPADSAVPRYYQVASIKPQPMLAIYPRPALTYVELVTTDGSELTITKESELLPYLTRQMVRLESLRPGSRILVWTDGEGKVTRTMLFAYEYQGTLDWTEQGQVLVDQSVLKERARTIGGETYLPVRAVAEAAGYAVSWDRDLGVVVSWGDGMVQSAPSESKVVFSVRPDEAKVLTGEGERPLSAACRIDQGVTYLPAADLAELLDLFW